MAERPSPWISVAVALAIALAAFAVAQIVQGAGIIVVLGASTAWAVIAQKLWSKNARG